MFCPQCQNYMDLYTDTSSNIDKESTKTMVYWKCPICDFEQVEKLDQFEIIHDSNINENINTNYDLYDLDPCLLRKYLKCSVCKAVTSHCVFNYDKYSMKNAYMCETCKKVFKL